MVAEYDVSAELNQIDFGATGVKEILQNVRMILATALYSCPMDRDFAWDPDVDAPINTVAQGKKTARIIEAIRKYEPRAQVVSVSYQADVQDGKLKPTVKVVIEDGEI